ncbi:MAG: hypothetical protein Q9180_006471, partial [Flavoplaca navasiana]
IRLSEIHISGMAIFEAGFSRVQDVYTGQTDERFERLYADVQATRSWIHVSLSIRPFRYMGFAAYINVMMARGLVHHWHWSTYKHSKRDRGIVLHHMDVASIFELSESRILQAKKVAGLDRGRSHMVYPRFHGLEIEIDEGIRGCVNFGCNVRDSSDG